MQVSEIQFSATWTSRLSSWTPISLGVHFSALNNDFLFFFLYNISASITTAWSLRTLVAVLVNNPHIQRALQEETDHVMGDDLPRIKYRQHMPYTEAVKF